MIGILILGVSLLVAYTIYWRQRVREDENYKLHHEQLYPIAYIGDCKDSSEKEAWGVSMTGNLFTDLNGGCKVNTEDYLGFIIKGAGTDNIFLNDDLIFVKKTDSKDLTTFPKLVIVETKGHYLVRKAVRRTKSGRLITIKDLNGKENKDDREYRSRIVGIVDYDFKTN